MLAESNVGVPSEARDTPMFRGQLPPKESCRGERRKRTRDQRGVSWLNASERADVTVGAPEPTPG